MFICFSCKENFSDCLKLINHIRKFCPSDQSYYCGQPNCLRQYSSLRSLRNHLQGAHKKNGSREQSTLPIKSSDNNFSDEERSADSNLYLPSSSSQGKVIPAVGFLQTQIPLLLSSLYANLLIPRNVVQLIVDELHNILSIDLEKEIFVRLKEILPPDTYHQVASLVKPSDLLISNSLQDFVSDFRRLDYYKNLGTLIQPTEVTIGERLEGKRTTLGFLTVPVKCTMQVVELDKVLKSFFCLPNVLKETLDYQVQLQSSKSVIENIVQGSTWTSMKKKVESEVGLHFPIVVYWDDFEIGNPLGAQAGGHKLGAVYASLPFLPPHFVNSFKSIFLFALFHSFDRIKFGNVVIFSKIIDCLNNLSKNGITVETDTYSGVIKFHLCAFVGDNSVLSEALGFAESFSKYPCRMCRVDESGLQKLMREDTNLLRDMDSYASDLAICDLSKTGIKKKCCWLEVEGFNLFENVSTDMLDDWCQGVCEYAMKFVLFSLVKTYKLIPLPLLKTKLETFDYGCDTDTKPSTAISINTRQVTYYLSGSQMLTLMRYFALIVGLYVTEDHPVWKFFLLLRQITDRLINRRVYLDSCEALVYDIEELNRQYLNLSNDTLNPKFHFMIHYPRLMKKFGPLALLSTFRFEARHRLSQMAEHSAADRVNICKTIALKNQLVLNDLFLKREKFHRITYGERKAVSDETRLALRDIWETLPADKNIIAVSWVTIDGISYKPSYNVTIDLPEENDFLPKFAEITEIYVVDNDQVFFMCRLFKTVTFNGHYYAYEVLNTDDKSVFSYENLIAPLPNTLTILPTPLKLYVTMRSPLD